MQYYVGIHETILNSGLCIEKETVWRSIGLYILNRVDYVYMPFHKYHFLKSIRTFPEFNFLWIIYFYCIFQGRISPILEYFARELQILS